MWQISLLAIVVLVVAIIILVLSMMRKPVEKAEEPSRFDNVTCELVKPINREASKILKSIEAVTDEIGQGHRVLAEVGLPAFMKFKGTGSGRSATQSAFNAISRKRVDFLVIDKMGRPVLAVEYHGSGHYQGNAKNRDAVKRAALTAAELPLLEILNGDASEKTSNRIREQLGGSKIDLAKA